MEDPARDVDAALPPRDVDAALPALEVDAALPAPSWTMEEPPRDVEATPGGPFPPIEVQEKGRPPPPLDEEADAE